MKLTCVPTVPVVGAVVKETVSASGAIVIVLDAVANLLLALVALTLTVNVPLAL